MTGNIPLPLRFGIVVFSLMAAIAVYLFARIYPPEILTPLHVYSSDLAAYTGVFGSAPSLFYTLALGLIISACASSRSSARVHCLVWVGLAMLLELSQARIIAESIVAWLSVSLPNSVWVIAESYWTRGVFDPLDLLATFIGGSIALTLNSHWPLRSNNVRD